MTIRESTALRNHLLSGGSFRSAFDGGTLEIYSGAQPATADLAPTGTKLVTITYASGARTNEVQAQGTVTFSGTVVGATCTGITVNSIEIMGSTFTDVSGVLADFAAGVAAVINRNPKNLLYKATAALGVKVLIVSVAVATSAVLVRFRSPPETATEPSRRIWTLLLESSPSASATGPLSLNQPAVPVLAITPDHVCDGSFTIEPPVAASNLSPLTWRTPAVAMPTFTSALVIVVTEEITV